MYIDDEKKFGASKFVRFFIGIVGVIAGLILSRLFLVMPYVVQDDSMKPGLQKGDYVLFLKIGSPASGDIVLAESPVEQDKVILKRIITSGDKSLKIKNKRIYINNTEYKNTYSTITDNRVFPEYFSNRDNMNEMIIKKDEVFLLGDNLDHSMDSREFGPVHKERIIGRMIYKF